MPLPAQSQPHTPAQTDPDMVIQVIDIGTVNNDNDVTFRADPVRDHNIQVRDVNVMICDGIPQMAPLDPLDRTST